MVDHARLAFRARRLAVHAGIGGTVGGEVGGEVEAEGTQSAPHNWSSSPPPGLAFGEPDDRLQRGSTTPRPIDSIAGVSGILGRPIKSGDDSGRYCRAAPDAPPPPEGCQLGHSR